MPLFGKKRTVPKDAEKKNDKKIPEPKEGQKQIKETDKKLPLDGDNGAIPKSKNTVAGKDKDTKGGEINNDKTAGSDDDGEMFSSEIDEDKRLDVNYYCSRIKDEVTVVWELKPVEIKRRFLDPLPRIPTRVVVVMDISCSMTESYGPDSTVSKLDKLKMFTELLIKTLNNEDHLGIVTFGTTAKVAFPIKRMGPDIKEQAIGTVQKIEAGGVTNMAAGIMLAIDQFNSESSKGEGFVSILQQMENQANHPGGGARRYYDDNIILFTDGMANEGITSSDELISEIRKKIQAIKDESHLEGDYNIKIASLGTGGFLPEMLFAVGQEFSSDPYYFLEEESNMELNLLKPLLLRQNSIITNLKMKVTALNGVTLDRERMVDEFEPYHMEDDPPRSDTDATYWMYDIAGEMSRHIVCVLKLPPKHKTKLKKREILKLELQYRDVNMDKRVTDKTVHYIDIPRKEKVNVERDVAETAKHRARINARIAIDQAADCIYRFDRTSAKEIVQTGANDIREYCEYISNLLTSEESYQNLMHFVEPILKNLDHCDKFLGDFSVRWDDGWARLKALSSSIGREVPTSAGIYAPGAELFPVPKMTDRLAEMCLFLKEIYKSLGLSTGTVDNYYVVVQELQAKLHVPEEQDEEKEHKGIWFSETGV